MHILLHCLLYHICDYIADGEESETPVDRTLFVVNIPSYYTSEALSEVFSCFGTVESVIFLQLNQTKHYEYCSKSVFLSYIYDP